MRRTLLSYMVLGSALVTGSAGAQTALSGVEPTVAGSERRVDLTLTGRAQYNSNVTMSDEATAARRGLEREDVIFSPAVNVDISVPTGAVSLMLNGVVGYDFYSRNSRLSRERIDLNGGVAGSIAFCAVAVNGGFARRQTELANLDLLIANGEQAVKNVETVKRIGAVVGCGAPIGFRPFGLIQYEDSRNSADLRRGQNVESITYGGGVEYNQPSIGTIRAFFGARELDFRNRGTALFPGVKNVRVVAGGVGFRRDIGARLSVDAEVLYAEVQLPGNAGNEFNGLSWRLETKLRATSALSFSLKGGRQVTPGLGFQSDYVIQQDYSLEATLALGQRSILSVMPTYRKRDYRNSIVPVPGILLLEEDDTIGVSSRLSYQIGRKIGLLLDAGYDKRNSNLSVYDTDNFRGGVGVELKL